MFAVYVQDALIFDPPIPTIALHLGLYRLRSYRKEPSPMAGVCEPVVPTDLLSSYSHPEYKCIIPDPRIR